MNMKSYSYILMNSFLMLSMLCSQSIYANEPTGNKRLIVCSTTQIADFAKQVVGDRWVVKCILSPEQDPHLHQLTPNDSKLIAKADLILRNGLHLEGAHWMKTKATELGKQHLLVTCTDGITTYKIMEEEGGEKKEVNDPHAWFTPMNAAIYVKNIERAVAKLDPKHQAEYRARSELYLTQLRSLHRWIIKQVSQIPAHKRILVTSHDAFNYFCNEYGFKAAAPTGWSTDAELGVGIAPARRKQVIKSIQSFGIPAIFVETSVNPKMIRGIAKEAGVKIGGELYSDSMGAVGSAGETYIGMMRENVLIITRALLTSK